jgi:acyl-homoserine lactone acylase PvdQ
LPADDASDQAIAVAWTGARSDGGGAIEALLAVAHAGAGEEVRNALRAHDEPPIAMVWAEASGGAGLQVAGWDPAPAARRAAPAASPGARARTTGTSPWRSRAFPRSGSRRARASWSPPDQRFDTAGGRGSIDSLWRTGARAARLRALLATRKRRRPCARSRRCSATTGSIAASR